MWLSLTEPGPTRHELLLFALKNPKQNTLTMGSIAYEITDHDVLVIGAGLSGCYACFRMLKLGLNVKVVEAGSSVGGTWYWSEYLAVS